MKVASMLRRLFLTVGLVVLQSVGISLSADERKPNVVIIYTDDQGSLDANCYGSHDLYTPHLDRLAAEGVRDPVPFVQLTF